ncbi:hypothetical protein SeMB42_g04222 [Synchytrium endobioticum]|uniref:Response regulatory domain-containing protein n=1 Tax=Synchytrium endobioticum TaxID=286115 RepID=A0A507CZZ1_9FUNG|nr:hypothetical protein SeMB42_g04222 [Synchytrium endobioticum]
MASFWIQTRKWAQPSNVKVLLPSLSIGAVSSGMLLWMASSSQWHYLAKSLMLYVTDPLVIIWTLRRLSVSPPRIAILTIVYGGFVVFVGNHPRTWRTLDSSADGSFLMNHHSWHAVFGATEQHGTQASPSAYLQPVDASKQGPCSCTSLTTIGPDEVALIEQDIQRSITTTNAILSALYQQTEFHSNCGQTFIDALSTSLANLSHVASQLQRVKSAPVKHHEVLFGPCDLTEKLADAVAFYADAKAIDLLVHTPMGTGWYMTLGSPQSIRRILNKVLVEILMKIDSKSQVSLNLHTGRPTSTRRCGSCGFYLYRIPYSWSLVWTSPDDCPSTDDLSVYLAEVNGTYSRKSNGRVCSEEIRIEMEAVPLYCTFNVPMEIDDSSSLSEKAELAALSSNLKYARFAVLLTRHTQFIGNIIHYLQDWGGKVIPVAVANWAYWANAFDTDFTSVLPRDNSSSAEVVTSLIFIDDDLTCLETVTKNRLRNVRDGCPIIYATTPTSVPQVVEYKQVMMQHSNLDSSIHIITKPAGAGKILQALRKVMFVPVTPRQEVEAASTQTATSTSNALQSVGESWNSDQIADSQKPLRDVQNSLSYSLPLSSATIGALHFPKTGKLNVLLVEDNLVSQSILSTYLTHRGVQIVVASNGSEAVKIWARSKFHIVLMDIAMPIMDGIEATWRIRRIEQECQNAMQESSVFSETVIVALTASTLPTNRDRALAAGCNDYLQKPITFAYLERKLAQWGSMTALIESGEEPYDSLDPSERLYSSFIS